MNVVVYKNLLDSVDASLPSMHRYIRDRKKIMKLDEQHMYDIYAPLVSDAEMKLSYEEACDLVVRGLRLSAKIIRLSFKRDLAKAGST